MKRMKKNLELETAKPELHLEKMSSTFQLVIDILLHLRLKIQPLEPTFFKKFGK